MLRPTSRQLSRDATPEGHQVRPESLDTFQPSYASNKGKWVSSFLKTMPSEIGFPMTLTSGAFLNQKRSKQTSHELQKNLDSSCISFCTSSRKRQLKNITRWHKTLSASAISKQVSRCGINFPHELTCHILINQSIEIGLRAWPTRNYGEIIQKHVKASWVFASEISLKSKFLKCSSWTWLIWYAFLDMHF